MYRSCIAICFMLAPICNFGCSPAPRTTAPVAHVKGTIKMDGNPVSAGEIHFGMDGVPPMFLEIKNGVFSGETPVGENKVEFFIWVEGPASEKYGGARSKSNIAPEKYWGANTTLTGKVTAGGPNEFIFDLSK